MKYNYHQGVSRKQFGALGVLLAAVAFMLAVSAGLSLSSGLTGHASHNGAEVTVDSNACEGTTFTAAVVDPEGTHLTNNMRLVVYDGETTQFTDVIPTDGSTVEVNVGPFAQDTTVQWRVFGGGERDYDSPLWNGYGEPDFSQDVSDYGDANGFGWVVAGPSDPNPFTTWHEVDVEGCSPVEKDECKQGGWTNFGFRNQGQCIRYVNTGKDSR